MVPYPVSNNFPNGELALLCWSVSHEMWIYADFKTDYQCYFPPTY
jgi:hypothetical protein